LVLATQNRSSITWRGINATLLGVHRSEITIDLGAVRRNVRTLLSLLDGTELWAVVKGDGYGHGAVDVGRAALEAGASALCVATVPEALVLRAALPEARLIAMGPASEPEVASAREARLELVAAAGELPEGVPVHLKLDTGMGRWGMSELASPSREVVGLMTHLATADTDPAFAERQVERFRAATEDLPGLTRHAANSAAALRLPASRFDAVRCGIAVYGLSPFGETPVGDGLEPVLRWSSHLARVMRLEPGEGAGYGQTFVASDPTWIGVVPLGYADGFRRDLQGTQVVVGAVGPCPVVGTVSMDAFTVLLPRQLAPGTPVTVIGDGVSAEEHARVAGTINYEIVCGINSRPERAHRTVVGA
jgi:alanine racemase